jgi:formylglycine-generating enzyme required for sulfatase activity
LKKLLILSLLALGYQTASATSPLETFGSGANQFSMEFVTIGNPGNAPDSGGNPNPCGTVNYVYSIAKYEVSRDMVNKANSEGGLGITMRNMEQLGGNGVNKPAVGICWNEAARFVNWLNSKEGFPPAYNFEKAPGEEGYSVESNIILWAPNDKGYDESNKYRNSLAKYFIPTNDEWYKAAFYNSEKKEYSVYAVKADGQSPLVLEEAKRCGKKDAHHSGLEPLPITSGKESDGSVYGQTDAKGPADVDNAGGLSNYGTMAQSGNVCEWIETAQDGTNNDPNEHRQPRGGCWNTAVKEAGSIGSKVMYYNFGPSGWDGWPGGIRVVAKNPNASGVQGKR